MEQETALIRGRRVDIRAYQRERDEAVRAAVMERRLEKLDAFCAAWADVFPGNRLPDGADERTKLLAACRYVVRFSRSPAPELVRRAWECLYALGMTREEWENGWTQDAGREARTERRGK